MLEPFWGVLIILFVCPLLGGLPLIGWIAHALRGRQLAQVGTGNLSVSAAFYHGGTLTGVLAVLSEAFKGIAAVLIARAFFPSGSAWELVALIALVLGRYLVGKGAGTTNVVWGFALHDPLSSAFVFLLALISFTILRDRQLGKFGVLVLFPLIVWILHAEDSARVVAAIALAVLLGWIYKQIPDDLDLVARQAQPETQAVFEYLRGDKGEILSLSDNLNANFAGQKAANLSTIKGWGYPVPMGWVLTPGTPPETIVDFLQPSELSPLVVRSSAIGEDTEEASAAGQYETILNVTTKESLLQAILQVRASYDDTNAAQYRRDRRLPDTAMAVLIQQQVRSLFSGVAFSRDPLEGQGDAVVIEALPGSPNELVYGQVTPEQYRAYVVDTENIAFVQLEGSGKVPPVLVKQVAYLSRHLEERFHGVPLDIEWSYDGQTLWVLQARPITTLLPIWTRKIAAEVIPGLIRPLTWSINRPLTCGVWGGIFAIVLRERSLGLDFKETATLHYSRSYFNASLLGKIFIRMGLPPESLEFLTRGAKMSKPPLNCTIQNLPGLLALALREFTLARDFRRDYHRRFAPALSQLSQEFVDDLEPTMLVRRVDFILELLKKATYYSILAPLSAAIRQEIWRAKERKLDYSQTPEVSAMRELSSLATSARVLLPEFEPETVFSKLGETSQGQEILVGLERFILRYGYLSEVGTDIAVPTWREQPETVRRLFVQLMQNNEVASKAKVRKSKGGVVQSRVNLKGRVTEVYSRLLAELRWTFVSLEKRWLRSGLLRQPGDIFFLEIEEVRRIVDGSDQLLIAQVDDVVQRRKAQLTADSRINPVPLLVYGSPPPVPLNPYPHDPLQTDQVLRGIAASAGYVEGRIKIVRDFNQLPEIDRETILVVPYTDSAWAPLLARAGGLIAEVGGRLSHGAIVAREYGIPAIMDVSNATWLLQDGQWVRMDGARGIVEISNDMRPR